MGRRAKTLFSDFPVIGLLGHAGSGKSLVADWLEREKGFVSVSFADPMKRFVLGTFGFTESQLWGPSEERNKAIPTTQDWWFNAAVMMQKMAGEILEIVDDESRVAAYLKLSDWLSWLRQTYPDEISPREVLQTLGTEWGRETDPLMWVKRAHVVALELSNGKFIYSPSKGMISHTTNPNPPRGVVIPDHRFLNEVDTTRLAGGHVIRLRRLSKEAVVTTVGIKGHESEAAQKNIPDNAVDLVIELQEGIENVHSKLETVFAIEPWIGTQRAGGVGPLL